ncbi:hypothetical protein CsSME_00027694 [Camellia sinensis var. sinensis]
MSMRTDSDWYPDRLTCQDIVRPVKKDTGYNKAWFFNSRFGNKWCYNLTTVKNQDYLIRGTFRYGDLQGIPPGSFFNVLIGVAPIGTMNSVYETEVEAIFQATNDYIEFELLGHFSLCTRRRDLGQRTHRSLLNPHSSNAAMMRHNRVTRQSNLPSMTIREADQSGAGRSVEQ